MDPMHLRPFEVEPSYFLKPHGLKGQVNTHGDLRIRSLTQIADHLAFGVGVVSSFVVIHAEGYDDMEGNIDILEDFPSAFQLYPFGDGTREVLLREGKQELKVFDDALRF
jgi:hypothetical protein